LVLDCHKAAASSRGVTFFLQLPEGILTCVPSFWCSIGVSGRGIGERERKEVIKHREKDWRIVVNCIMVVGG
ncbi:MAG: hypothetical protein ACNA71_09380, partial [Kiritimatiellia bacterium]